MSVTDKLRALQIKVNLIADEAVGLMEIETEVHDGIATLTGEVETQEQKQRAEELAYEVDGIHEVDNDLSVLAPTERSEECEGKVDHLGYGPIEGDLGQTMFTLRDSHTGLGPGAPTSEQFPGEFTDEEIEEEVTEILALGREVDASKVEMRSTNQIVYLQGSVKTPEDVNRLQDMVINVRGVMGICSELSVKEGQIGTPMEEV